jgi:PPOX class probable F420-dependent enzyme
MDLEQARQFIRENHRAVAATRRRDGGVQMSPVAATVDDAGRVVISSRETAYKTRNIRRDPEMSVLVVTDSWWGPWVRVDGVAEVISLPEAMDGLIAYYRSISGEHPHWEEYRQAMVSEQRVVIAITLRSAGPDAQG